MEEWKTKFPSYMENYRLIKFFIIPFVMQYRGIVNNFLITVWKKSKKSLVT